MKLLSKSKDTRGLVPGEVVFTGKKKIKEVVSSLIEYDKKSFSKKIIHSPNELSKIFSSRKVSWVDIVGLHDTGLITNYSDLFKLHPLIREDIAHVGQRPKIENYDNCIFVVLKMAYFDDSSDSLSFEQVSFVLTNSVLLSFQEREGDVFQAVRNRLENYSGKIRERGADYLLYALMDAIIDNYFVVLESIGDKLEGLENLITTNPTPEVLESIRSIKQDLIFLRKAAWPLRELVSSLERDGSKMVTSQTKLFLRDLYDHSIQVIDLVETFKDLSSGLLDTYNSMMGNRMNEIMKVLTIISTIFIPITFLAGVYGMNFAHMPELAYKWSYPILLGLMVLVALFMLSYFRRKKWL